jgi:hypothetical protein
MQKSMKSKKGGWPVSWLPGKQMSLHSFVFWETCELDNKRKCDGPTLARALQHTGDSVSLLVFHSEAMQLSKRCIYGLQMILKSNSD